MRAHDIIELAWVGISRTKVRTGLTAVGVTVGVFALTIIIGMGQGLERALVAQLTDDESQTQIVVRPGFGTVLRADGVVEGVSDPVKADRLRKAIAKRKRGGPAQMRRTLLTSDAVAKLRELEHVRRVRPFTMDSFGLQFGDREEQTALSFGVLPDAPSWNARVIAGQPFVGGGRGVWLHEYLLYTWGYRTDAEQAALVGQPVTITRPQEMGGVAALVAAARAQGIEIPLEGAQAEQVLGLIARRSGTAPPPRRTDDGDVEGAAEAGLELPILGIVRERVEADGFEFTEDSFSMQADMFLPQGLAEELFEQVPSNVSRGYNAVSVEVDEPSRVAAIERKLKQQGYRTLSVGTMLERIGLAMAIITAVVSGLTAIALFVAALGIVNTMVMNVTERTREIGVLKALGGTDLQVRALFLVESALIGLGGGALGVGLAILASYPGDALAQRAIREATEYSFDGTIFSFSGWLVGLGMAFAVGLSVFAAVGPAIRASRVDPVRALRDE